MNGKLLSQEFLEIEYCSFDNLLWFTIRSHNFWWLIKIFRNPDGVTFTHVPPLVRACLKPLVETFTCRAWSKGKEARPIQCSICRGLGVPLSLVPFNPPPPVFIEPTTGSVKNTLLTPAGLTTNRVLDEAPQSFGPQGCPGGFKFRRAIIDYSTVTVENGIQQNCRLDCKVERRGGQLSRRSEV